MSSSNCSSSPSPTPEARDREHRDYLARSGIIGFRFYGSPVFFQSERGERSLTPFSPCGSLASIEDLPPSLSDSPAPIEDPIASSLPAAPRGVRYSSDANQEYNAIHQYLYEHCAKARGRWTEQQRRNVYEAALDREMQFSYNGEVVSYFCTSVDLMFIVGGRDDNPNGCVLNYSVDCSTNVPDVDALVELRNLGITLIFPHYK